jgi:hypothetical protein
MKKDALNITLGVLAGIMGTMGVMNMPGVESLVNWAIAILVLVIAVVYNTQTHN